MKINRVDIKKNIGNGSSYKVYVCKTWEAAMAIHKIAMTMKPEADGENYFTVHSAQATSCIVPDFFRDKGYCETIIEHNNGNWKNEPTYELYIVD